MRRDYHFPDDPATFTILSDRDIAGPQGIFGGKDGRKAFYILNPEGPDGPSENAVELTSKCVIELQPGDTVSFQTPGGGGYGPPEERDPQLVLRDVIGGKVNRERAHECYGVVIDEHTNLVDEAATLKARTLMSNSRESTN
jgi:N-methylhydantoinase B